MQSNLLRFVGVIVLGSLIVSGCANAADSANSRDPATATANSSLHIRATPAAAVAGDVGRGAAIYTANCAGCHGLKGVSSGIGPSLIGERGRKSAAATIEWIKNPQPPMAKLYPSPLSEKDVVDVTAYVESL
jgi:mono/diheme cytochrome c family protein